MLKIFPAQYHFARETEVKYIEWMFERNKKLLLWITFLVVSFITFVTVFDLITEELSFDFNIILVFRIIMACLTLSILYVFKRETPYRAQYILFIDLLLIIILNTIDSYICLREMDNVLNIAIQMFSIYLFMLVPFISFIQKFILGCTFISGIVFCIIDLKLVNNTEVLFFVSFIFVAEMLVSYRLEILFRAQFKAMIDDKKHTDELKQSKQELEEALVAEREVIKQNLNFIDMISHEYRTPLSIITTSIDSLETLPIVNDSENVNHYVRMIRRASRRLLSIYESSLHEKRINLSGIMPYKKSVEVLTIVEMAVEFTRSIYPAHQIFIEDNIRPGATIIVDNELLTTAIINVIDNACKYSQPSKVNLCLVKENSTCVIKVIDSGYGIDSSEIEAVFEKYYRSGMTKQKPGAGVGLYLVKKIVELHGGTVEISSNRNEGTTIMISIPFSQDDNE